jgi:nucleotide-binding universal stress UspA family protein
MGVKNVWDRNCYPSCYRTYWEFFGEKLALVDKTGIRQMLEERTYLCKKAGEKEVSCIIRLGRPADEIVRLVGERYYDLIVMASSRISSTIRIILGSNVKRVLDSVPKPILIIR